MINKMNFIPGWEFRSSFYDDSYTVGGTIQGAAELSRQGVRAVIGGTSSTLAIAAQNFLAGLNIPFISGTATSDVLSDKVTFPFFSRTIAPDRFQGRVMSDLAKQFNWKKVCTLNYQGDYPTNLINQFVTEFSASGPDVQITRVTYTLSDPDLKAPMKALADAKCRIIFSVLSASSLFPNVWMDAKAAGLLGPGIQWIAGESIYGEMTADNLRTDHKLDPQDLKGLLIVTPLGGKDTSAEYIRFQADYANWTGIPNKSIPDNYITHIYDAVWSLARAARNIVLSPTIGAGQLLNSTAYLASLRTVQFAGVTGNVGFDRNGDRTNGVFGIFQWTGNAFPIVGDWEGLGVQMQADKLVFADGTKTPPVDRILVPETSILFGWGGIATISAVAALALLLLAITFIINIAQRKNTLIYKSSPLFLQFICVGLILLVASIFFWFGDAATWKCHIRVWFGFIGFSLAYGALLVKNARLWYLFSEPSLRIIAITNQQLTTYLMLILGPQIILLVLWSSLSPFTISSVSNAAGTLRYQLCTSSNDIILGPISFAYMGILLLVGGFLSFKTRTLPDVFRESQYIALSTYNYLFVATICIIIGYAISSEAVIGIAVATVGVLFGSLMQWGLLFVPKYYLIFFKPDVVAAMSNTTRRSVTSSVTTASTPKSSKYDTQNSL
jgi:ABC-type branched-subunit amino acid transport system substrate-binding protein